MPIGQMKWELNVTSTFMIRARITFLVFTFLLGSCVGSRITAQEPIFTDEKYNDPTYLIQRNYKPDRQELYKICMNSIVFVKFAVGADGNVQDVAVSKDAPAAIAEALKAAVFATNGHWTPKLVDSKPVKSDPYVMPLMFYYSLGCSGRTDITSSNQFNDGMSNMLDFDDGNRLLMLKCTLLPAFITAAHN